MQVGCVTKRTLGGGLGISLEGTVDVEDGVEVTNSNFVLSVLCVKKTYNVVLFYFITCFGFGCYEFQPYIIPLKETL